MASFDPVTALMRGIDVLRVVNTLQEASIAQISRETGLHKSTVLRMLETLIHQGYVVRQTTGPTYVVTGKCLLLSNGLQRVTRLAQVAVPLMAAFQKSVGWPSDFAVFDHDAMMIAATNREFGVMSFNRKIGTRVPILASSLGRAYLAFCSESEQAAILARLESSDGVWDAPAKDRTGVRKMIDEIRRQGYATTDPHYHATVYESAIWGISVPVMAGGTIIATTNVMFLATAMPLDKGVRSLAAKLLGLAAEIGKAIEGEFGNGNNARGPHD